MFDRLRSLPLDVVYLVLATPLLLAMIYIQPPFQSPDEPSHYFRAVQLSHGEVMPTFVSNSYRPAAGAAIEPAAIGLVRYHCPLRNWFCPRSPRPPASAIFARDALAQSEPREITSFSNTVIYLPIAHALPAAAIAVARGLALPPLAWMYAGRLANVLFALGATWLALRLLRGRNAALPAFAIATLPMTLHLEPTLSADVGTISCGLLLLATCVRLLDAERAPWLWPVLALASPFAAAAKLAYLPLAIVPPAIAMISRAPRSVIVGTLLIAAATIMLTIGWSTMVHAYVFPQTPNPYVDIPGQTAFLREHPVAGARNLLVSMATQAPKLLIQLGGRQISSHPMQLPWLLIVPPVLALVAALAVSGTRQTPRLLRLFVLLVLAACTSATFLFLYLQDTPVGAAQVRGYQGRYLLPIIPFLALALPPWNPLGMRENGRIRAIVIGLDAVIAIATVSYLWLHPWR